ncbi:DNA/RNA non-specific endonuclease [Streptomyces sp. NPDC059255]|uniref:DNA/RNA non-specific endonuclease n=1 Tax=Streptomyces sp. NPDC059255 TaxID=3346793 RepID=UPI003696339D
MAVPLLIVLAVGATTTGTAPAPQEPGASPRQVGRLDPADPAGVPTPTETTGTTRTRPVTVAAGEHCEPVRPGSREGRAGAVEACVTTSVTPVKPGGREAPAAARQAAPAVAADDDSATCAITTPGMWNYGRFGYCVNGLTVLYLLKDGNGKEIGTGTLDVATSALLPADRKTWNEYVTVTMTGATGAVTALTAKFRSACSTGCKATKTAPWYGGDLVKGQSVNGFVSYSSTPAAGAKVEFTTSYQLYVTSPGAQITDPNASWSNPERIRCDDDVRDTTSSTSTPGPGCVVPSVMPVVRMSANASGSAAAAGYLWAQENLADGWGRDKPLTRAKSGIADRTNRTCGGSKPFEAKPDYIANDSCGEFPFAATHEGGTDGARCAEIIPNYSSGGWDFLEPDGGTDRGSPCARVHAPLADNQAAEAQLFEGFVNQRVVEAEQFKVEITGSTAEPQAACLQNPPAGALPSSSGWVKNTTERVPLANKTIPLGPAGDRAATAVTCIAKDVKEGSPAEGDITGWQDAQAYAAAHSPGTGLARCHLIANILGGKGGERDGGPRNLAPCWQVGMNTGTPSMRTYEFAAQRLVADNGFGANDAILYQVTPHYRDATSTIPEGVTMSATVERADGTSQPLFPTVYITNTQRNTGLFNLGN